MYIYIYNRIDVETGFVSHWKKGILIIVSKMGKCGKQVKGKKMKERKKGGRKDELSYSSTLAFSLARVA